MVENFRTNYSSAVTVFFFPSQKCNSENPSGISIKLTLIKEEPNEWSSPRSVEQDLCGWGRRLQVESPMGHGHADCFGLQANGNQKRKRIVWAGSSKRINGLFDTGPVCNFGTTIITGQVIRIDPSGSGQGSELKAQLISRLANGLQIIYI